MLLPTPFAIIKWIALAAEATQSVRPEASIDIEFFIFQGVGGNNGCPMHLHRSIANGHYKFAVCHLALTHGWYGEHVNLVLTSALRTSAFAAKD